MWLNDFLNLFFPNICQACGRALFNDEKIICLSCNYKLPRTNFHYFQNNPVSRIFWGRVKLTSATSFLFFNKGGHVQKLMHQFKYKGKYETAKILGIQMGTEIKQSNLFSDIDIIIPVPLHERKLKKRGYNQSEMIAHGMASAMEATVETDILIRTHFTETQTKKSRYNRWENVKGKFEVRKESKLYNKHILLVDDVLTTGATLEACAQHLVNIPNTKISVATLAYAQV